MRFLTIDPMKSRCWCGSTGASLLPHYQDKTLNKLNEPSAFRAAYGPWALITGASDGTGAAFARRLASLGLNIVLIARREGPLNALSQELKQQYGVETRTASIDLYQNGAGQRVIDAANGLDVGLFVSNAGSDPNGSAFLTAPLSVWQEMMQRNIAALVEPAHHFVNSMVERGRGGIIVMSSGAALGGQAGGVVYSATKAFGLNFAESLWAELSPKGVDVICAVCGAMNTPSLNKLLDERNLSVPGLLEPDDVIETLLERLGETPLHVFAFQGNDAHSQKVEDERRQRLALMEQMSKAFYGDVSH